MAKVTFRTDKCKGCGLCTTVCPKKIVIMDLDFTLQQFQIRSSVLAVLFVQQSVLTA